MTRKLPARKGRPPSERPERRRAGKSDPNDRRYCARHEAGHAVAAVVHGHPLDSVTIIKSQQEGRQSYGYTRCPIPTREVAGRGRGVLPWLVQLLAGPAAEHHINPDMRSQGSDRGDRHDAQQLATIALCEAVPAGGTRGVIPPEEQSRNWGAILSLLQESETAAHEFVEVYRDAIDAVAAALITRSTLKATEVAAIVAAHPPRPR